MKEGEDIYLWYILYNGWNVDDHGVPPLLNTVLGMLYLKSLLHWEIYPAGYIYMLLQKS